MHFNRKKTYGKDSSLNLIECVKERKEEFQTFNIKNEE